MELLIIFRIFADKMVHILAVTSLHHAVKCDQYIENKKFWQRSKQFLEFLLTPIEKSAEKRTEISSQGWIEQKGWHSCVAWSMLPSIERNKLYPYIETFCAYYTDFA